MALYDNQHWLLSHIRDSFLSTDNTGKCEMVMLGDDIPKQLSANGILHSYPSTEESDGDDLGALAESYDIKMDMEFSLRRCSNTGQRLGKMTRKVKWDHNPENVSVVEETSFFERKNFRKQKIGGKKHSLLSEQLAKCPVLPKNIFKHYAKFDGNAQVDIPVRKYRIFMYMLPEKNRMYPLQVVVVVTAKVSEFIGLICYKYATEHPDHPLKEDISRYGLYFTEDDGEIDWDLPCLEPGEPISKYDFITLGLVEIKPSNRPSPHIVSSGDMIREEEFPETKEEERKEVADDLAKMEGHTTAMEAPLYQSYRVQIINKMRAKTEIYLGISGEKIEINPAVTGKGASRFWNRQRAVSYQMDNIACCEVSETKGSKTVFTLIYTPHTAVADTSSMSSTQPNSLRQSFSFKNHEFEADSVIAEEIVRKINHILALQSSSSRRDYLSQKERKAARRKSFHLHR